MTKRRERRTEVGNSKKHEWRAAKKGKNKDAVMANQNGHFSRLKRGLVACKKAYLRELKPYKDIKKFKRGTNNKGMKKKGHLSSKKLE